MPERPKFFTHCPVCNAETPSGVVTCPNCGVDLEIARSNVMKDVIVEAGKVGYVAGQITGPPSKPKKKINWIWMIAIVFICLILYGVFKDLILFPILYSTTTYQPTPAPTITLNPASLTKNAFYSNPSTPSPSCLLWSQVTPQMAGRTLCVYGTVNALYPTNETWTRIKFTTQPNTFFIYSQLYIFPDLKAGECVKAIGVIQLYESIPYLETDNLYYCT